MRRLLALAMALGLVVLAGGSVSAAPSDDVDAATKRIQALRGKIQRDAGKHIVGVDLL